jgi:hypothetical protein
MAVEVNQTSDTLQLKHQPTGKWSEGVTLLRLEEGFDIRLVDEQMTEIESLVQAVASLATLSSAQEIQKGIKAVEESLGKLLTQETNQSTSITNFYQAVSNAVAQLTQLSTAANATNQSIASNLTALSNAIASLTTSLTQLSSDSGSSAVADTGESEIDERVIVIPSAGNVQSVILPNTTRSLVFSGRKDSLGRSHDIFWSFRNDNMTQGKHKILWAFCEFQKTGLSFKDKVLYLSCGAPIQIDVCAYYS